MPINPYINFPGNCREAVEFYARVFQTEKPQIRTFGEMPADPSYLISEEVKNRVMHTRLDIAGTSVMFSDTFPDSPFVAGNNVSLTLVSKDREEIVARYNALKEGGTVQMELQETFWSKAYGSLRDKYGIEWQFSLDSGETFP